jgi:hypothetical protein
LLKGINVMLIMLIMVMSVILCIIFVIALWRHKSYTIMKITKTNNKCIWFATCFISEGFMNSVHGHALST